MITFVAAAYKENLIVANQFISSMILQSDNRWKCIIYCDAPNPEVAAAVASYNDPRIKLVDNKEPTRHWGHYNRIDALNNLVDTEFVVQTSIQDYYTPNTVKEILERADHDFIYFNCIHNHHKYTILNSELKEGRIDWGSFAVKTSVAKEVGIREPRSSWCDGTFVVHCIAKGIKHIKIDKVLTVHN